MERPEQDPGRVTSQKVETMTQTKPNIRLLMVDDERDFLQAVEPGMARRGFDVSLAESGIRALELLEQQTFDVVVLDVKMPGIDGVDTFREISRRYPGLPVILLTGHGDISQAFETSREGVHEYLTKPCDVERLAEVVREAASRGRPREEAQPLPSEVIRLLLVDDDMEFVRSLTPALERRGIDVTEALDGSQALERVSDRFFDVALVDVVMPGMDGLTLLDRLKETDPFMEVIMLTGNPEVGDARRGLKEGAFDYLTKPQPVEALVKAIRAAWARRRAWEEEARQAEADRILRERPE
jgi:two-component system, NtrC family, response regulator HydG